MLQSRIIAADEYKQPDGTYILEDGHIILPEEFDFYDDLMDVPVDWYAEDFKRVEGLYDKTVKVSPSEWTEFAIKIAIEGIPTPFCFIDREYMKTPYDIQTRRVLLMCGRQVEKCLSIHTLISTSDGEPIYAGEVRGPSLSSLFGISLCSYSEEKQSIETGRVTWKSAILLRPGRRILTRQGHEIEVGDTHPMLVWAGWKPARELQIGDRIAVVRRAGNFGTQKAAEEQIELNAFFIGDGCTVSSNRSVTGLKNSAVLERCREIALALNLDVREYHHTETTTSIYFRPSQIDGTHLDSEVIGKKSENKIIPKWIFSLTREKTALFLNRLWATDGHVKQNGKSKWSVEYCSTSKMLIRQVQSLLWKFGIPSKIRENWPNYWKKQDVKKTAYILRIETLMGVKSFLAEIGALGKTEETDLPEFDADENNNRDTLPIEVNELIREINRSRPGPILYGDSLRTHGLRETLKYPPTRDKVLKYVEFFRQGRYNQLLVDRLEAAVQATDVYWDTIEEIEEIPELECVDFTVEPNHSFIADGFITHNSTLLGNSILAKMCIAPHFRAIYVSPTHEQTKVFRRDRIGEPIALSEILQAYISTQRANNIALIKFVNYSQLTLRYAYLTADRVRGIPADSVYIDEIQDILTDNIPVIEECATHANPIFKSFTYSGTPKSFDNTIEYLWGKRSTKNEWAVPCTCRTIHDMAARSTRDGQAKRFWNIPLNEENMGLKNLICARCGAPINAAHQDCQWAAMNAEIRNHPRLEPFEGFRIPQIMVPWVEWKDLLNKRESYSRSRFINEVLAMSYDSGDRPLRMEDLMRNSIDNLTMAGESIYDLARGVEGKPVFMGIDWGTGEKSFTVMCLGTYMYGLSAPSDKLYIFYWKRYVGQELDPELQVKDIIKTAELFRPLLIGADYGGGFDRNKKLMNAFGPQRFVKYQYVGGHRSASKRPKLDYDSQKGRYLVERTEVMSDMFNAIKDNKFGFPRWQDWAEPFASDMLSIFSEYNETTRMIQYDKSPNSTDDSFHSALYCFLASYIRFPRPDILRPVQESPR